MNSEADIVQPEKNLHTFMPSALLSELQKAAQAEHVTMDELVQNAVENLLNRKEWQEVLSFGERHAKDRGLTENDIADAIVAVRSEASRRGR